MCLTKDETEINETYISVETDGKFCTMIYENHIDESTKNNAMILPVPTLSAITIETEEKFFVKNLWDKLTEDLPRPNFRANNHVTKGLYFQKVGSYRVAQCEIEELSEIVSPEMFKYLFENYCGWKFVVAYFDSENIGDMHPIKIVYEPFEEMVKAGWMFVPMVDAHGVLPVHEEEFKPHQEVIVNGVPLWRRGKNHFTTNNRDYWFRNSFNDWSAANSYDKTFFVGSVRDMTEVIQKELKNMA